MKELLKQYTTYNTWANQRLFERIGQLDEEQINLEIVSSFPGIYKTVLHMWDAESIWWQRLKLVEQAEGPGQKFSGSFAELSSNSLLQSKQWEEWIDNASENQLQHVFAYQ